MFERLPLRKGAVGVKKHVAQNNIHLHKVGGDVEWGWEELKSTKTQTWRTQFIVGSIQSAQISEAEILELKSTSSLTPPLLTFYSTYSPPFVSA